jgi:hypothetical protein
MTTHQGAMEIGCLAGLADARAFGRIAIEKVLTM